MCGLPGSGKTTCAKKLEQTHNAVRFSLDEWMIALYGHHMSRELFDARLERCKNLILETAEKLLVRGVSVVLDFGFWKRDERQQMKAWLETRNLDYKFYYFDLPFETLWERLEVRNNKLPNGTFEVSRDMLELFWGWFEVPTDTENLTLVRVVA